MPRRALVTGGAGFIGSHVARRLSSRTADAVDRSRQSLERASARTGSARRRHSTSSTSRSPEAARARARAARSTSSAISPRRSTCARASPIRPPMRRSTSAARSICSRPCVEQSRRTRTRFVFSSHGRRGVRRSRRAAHGGDSAPRIRSRRTGSPSSASSLHGVLRARARSRLRSRCATRTSTDHVRIRTARRASSRSSATGSSTARRSRSSAMAGRRATTCSSATWRARISLAATATLPPATGARQPRLQHRHEHRDRRGAARDAAEGAVRRASVGDRARARALRASSGARRCATTRPGRCSAGSRRCRSATGFARLTNGSRHRRAGETRMTHGILMQVGGAIPTSPDRHGASGVAGDAGSCSCSSLVLSLVSWAIMLAKWCELHRVTKRGREFIARVRAHAVARRGRGADAPRQVESVHARLHARRELLRRDEAGRAARSRRAAAAARIAGRGAAARARLGDARRSATSSRRFIPWLATIGSVSPLIGLLGTVLGVIDAFIGIATKGSGNLSAVAPGVAEALTATAAALAVAIPAVFGYNIFAARLESPRE